MFERARDFTARALLPALLLALALLQHPLGQDIQSAGCRRMSSAQYMRHLGKLDPEVDEHLHALTFWIEASARAMSAHLRYIFALTFLFALAYLLLARERVALRIGVFAGVLLAPFLLMVFFGYLC